MVLYPSVCMKLRRHLRRRITRGGTFSRLHPVVDFEAIDTPENSIVSCQIYCQDIEAAGDVLDCLGLRQRNVGLGKLSSINIGYHLPKPT